MWVMMDYFPLFVAVKARKVLFVGGSLDIVHKVRLVLKSTAEIHVFSPDPVQDVVRWQDQGLLTVHAHAPKPADCEGAVFAFIDGDDDDQRDHARALFDGIGLLYAVIDDQSRSRFITPALVDRDPVVVAIGTEGTGPVLARHLKAQIDMILHQKIGSVARIAGRFRPDVEILPKGLVRRQFWARFFGEIVPKTWADQPEDFDQHLTQGRQSLLAEAKDRGINDDAALNDKAGEEMPRKDLARKDLALITVQSPDAGLLTRRAFQVIHDADVVVYDAAVDASILELTRREAEKMLVADDTPDDLADALAHHHQKGAQITYLHHTDRQVSPLKRLLAERHVPITEVTGYVLPPTVAAAPEKQAFQRLKVAS